MKGMTFMLWSHVHPMMALKGDKSFTNENCTFWVIGPVWTSNTMSPRKVIDAPLNPDSICPRFSRADGGSPIFLYVDICKRSTELARSIKILLTSKSLILSVRIRASSCGWSTRLGSIGGKVIIPSTGRVSSLGRSCWMELTCSLTEAAQSNLCLFHLELYFSSTGPPWM